MISRPCSAHLRSYPEQAQQLLDGRSLHLIATVHAPGAAPDHAETAGEAPSRYPRRSFFDLWEADKYLDEQAAEVAI